MEMVMVIKEEDYKRSFSIIVLITKDFSEVGDNRLNLMSVLVINEELHMEMFVISAESV